MKASTIWIVVIVIVLIVIGLIAFQSKSVDTSDLTPGAGTPVTDESTAPVTNTPAPQTYTVTYTNSGFDPATVNVKAGDTVQFINNSSSTMWVASDPHPTHNLYPEFDQKASVSTGGRYSFTFDKLGSWGYHNHKNPSSKGTVVVE